MQIKVRSPDRTAFFLFLICVLPQFILKPFGGELSIIDLMAPIIFAFCFLRPIIKLPLISRVCFLYLIYIYLSFLLNFAFSNTSSLYKLQTPYLLRVTAIWCPIFLGPYFARCYSRFEYSGKITSFLCGLAIFSIVFSYAHGSQQFDAFQTYDFSGNGVLIHRLGGLPGETGAFAFNAVFVAEIIILFWALAEGNSKKSGFISFLFATAIVFFAYKYSVARVALLNYGVFLLFLIIGRNFSSVLRLYILLGLAIVLTIITGWFVVPLLKSGFFARFDFTSADSLNIITSGRYGHWVNIVEILFNKPIHIFLGFGNRMGDVVANHAIENFFLTNIADYGLLGLLGIIFLLGLLLKPIWNSHKLGDLVASGILCMWFATLSQWLFNDVINYYETMPSLLLLTSWYAAICRLGAQAESDTASLLGGDNPDASSP